VLSFPANFREPLPSLSSSPDPGWSNSSSTGSEPTVRPLPRNFGASSPKNCTLSLPTQLVLMYTAPGALIRLPVLILNAPPSGSVTSTDQGSFSWVTSIPEPPRAWQLTDTHSYGPNPSPLPL